MAEYLAERFNWSQDDVDRQLQQSMAVSRDKIFDRVLTQKGVWSEQLITDCVDIYRQHMPNIRLSHQTKRLLKEAASDYSLYVVTDGHATVQQNKLDILGLTSSVYIKRCFATYALGMDHAKPSPKCFQMIADNEQCLPEQIVYIADNARKDFVGIKPLGFRTIRVETGQHRSVKLDSEHEAEFLAEDLTAAIKLVKTI